MQIIARIVSESGLSLLRANERTNGQITLWVSGAFARTLAGSAEEAGINSKAINRSLRASLISYFAHSEHCNAQGVVAPDRSAGEKLIVVA